MRSIFALLPLAIIFLMPLYSKQILLDEVMNLEDQQRTGVAFLTPNQKIALEEWINKYCNCFSSKANQEDKQNLFLSINIDNGKKIQLNDNSIWEVDPRDYAISEAWLSPFPIKITTSDDPDYPFLLVNKDTGVSIRVKKSQMPAPSEHLPPPATTPSTVPPANTPKAPPPKPASPPPPGHPQPTPPQNQAPGAVPMPPAPNPKVTPSPTVSKPTAPPPSAPQPYKPAPPSPKTSPPPAQKPSQQGY